MARLDEVLLDEQSDDDVEIRGVADEKDPDEEDDMEDGDDEDKVKENEGGAASKDDKPAEPAKKRRPRFTEDHLCGERGLQKAYETFPKMCQYRGEGHEAEFLNRLLRCYMEWSHSLFPYMQFEEMVDRLQSMGGKAKVRRKLEELRGIQREAYLKQRYGQDYEKDLEESRKAKLREEAKEEEEATRRHEELYGASRRRNTETRRPDGEPEIEDLGAEVEVTREKKKEGKAKELFASDEEDFEGPRRSGGGGNGADGSDKEEPADEDQEEEPVKAKRGRGKGKSKGRAQKQRKDAKPKGRGRRRKKNVLSDSDRDNDEKEMSSAAGESESDEHEKPKGKKLRMAGPTRRSKAKSKRNRSEDEEDADQADDASDSGKGSSPKPGSSADDNDDDSRLKEFLRGQGAQGQHKVLSAKAIANRAIHECDLHDRDPKSVKAAIVAIHTELTQGEASPEKEPQGGKSVDKAPSKVVDVNISSGDEQAKGHMRKKSRTWRVKRHAESDDDDNSDLDVEREDSTGKPTAMDVQEMGAAKMDSEEDNSEEEGPDVTLMMDDGEETVPQDPQVGESSGHDAEDDGATESVAEHAAGRGEEPRQADLELDETIHMDLEPETVAQEAVDLDESAVRSAANAGSILDDMAADESAGALEDAGVVPTGMETEDAKEGSVAPVDDEERMVSQDF